MKVTIVSSTFHSAPGAGTNYTVMYIARYLRAQGFNVEIISRYKYATRDNVGGIDRIAFRANSIPFLSISMVKYILKGQSDVYLFVGNVSYNLLFPWLKAKKMVLIPQWHKEFASRNNFTRLLLYSYRVIAKVSVKISQPKIICFTEEEKSMLRKFTNNISVKPLGLDFNRTLWQSFRIAPIQKKTDDKVRLLYVGRVVSHKFPLFILDSLEIANKKLNGKFVFDVVGLAEKEHLAALEGRLKGSPLEGHVIFKGGLSDEELAAYYKNADVFVFPSLGESFGFTIIEGLYAGLPIVACRVGVVPYLEKHGLAFGVDYGDVAGFAAKLLEAIQNSEEIKSKLLKMQPEIEQMFTINNFVKYVCQCVI